MCACECCACVRAEENLSPYAALNVLDTQTWVSLACLQIAFGYLVTLATNGSSLIPVEYGFFAAYTISGVCMCAALLVFLLGSKRCVRPLILAWGFAFSRPKNGSFRPVGAA